MTQPKSKSSKSKSKKTTTSSTAKKVKRTATAVKPVVVELETVATPEPIFTAAAAATPQVVSAPERAPARLVTRAEFMDLVRKEAYRRYTARRAFKQGSPFQDWVNAEAAVSGKLAAEGARLS
ncbi:MAG: hypothetical protein Q8L48_14040 [Archangium sp.]|nr:hypothetical protein [Archangium sp.]